MSKDLASMVRHQMDTTIGAFQFRSADFVPSRVLVYFLIGTEQETERFIGYMHAFDKRTIQPGYVIYLPFPDASEEADEALYQAFIRAMKEVADQRAVKHATKLSMIPVFLQCVGMQQEYFEALCSTFIRAEEKMAEWMEATNLTDVLWWPSVVLHKDLVISKNTFLRTVLDVRRQIRGGYSNYLMLLSDWDSDNLTVNTTTIAQTLVGAVVLLSMDGGGNYIREVTQEECVFSSHAFSICMPVHLEIAKRALSLLDWFRSVPEDHEECLAKFGRELADLPKHLWWESTWEKVPKREDGSITIEPLSSFCFNDGKRFLSLNDCEKEMREFAEKYYLSLLPVEEDFLIQPGHMMRFNEFWEIYQRFYGNCLNGLDSVFGAGKLDEFVDTYIPQMKVLTCALWQHGMPGYENAKDIEQAIRRMESSLSVQLENRARKLFKTLLSQSSNYSRRISGRLSELNREIQKLREELHGVCNRWQRDELNIDQEYEWKEDDRRELMDACLRILCSEEPVSLELLVRVIFSIAKNTLQLDTNEYFTNKIAGKYLNAGSEDPAESQEKIRRPLWDEYHDSRDKMLFPVQNVKSEWHFIYAAEKAEEMVSDFCGFVKDADENVYKHKAEQMTDRIEVVRISHPVGANRLFKSTGGAAVKEEVKNGTN
ncbi:MAG: hypothetical protein IJY06_09520 [Oscillospiraceae bacterium]|nr:hypothetical protein [Oscillospiraceae bacterium]